MKRQTSIIHDNPRGVFDCSCVVDVTMDGETVGLEFPQLARENDNLSPMVYVSMSGTRLKVSITDRDDVQAVFALRRSMKHGICPRCKRPRTQYDWEPVTLVCGKCQNADEMASDEIPIEEQNDVYRRFCEVRRGFLRDPIDNACVKC